MWSEVLCKHLYTPLLTLLNVDQSKEKEPRAEACWGQNVDDGGPSAPLTSAARAKKLEGSVKHKEKRAQAVEAPGQFKMIHDLEQHVVTKSQEDPVYTS